MDQSLISPSEVFTRTWHEGKKYLGTDIKEALGFVGIALLSFALAVISFYVPDSLRLALRVVDVVLLQIVGTTWITLRLTAAILAERQGKKLSPLTLSALGSFLLISILSGLATAGGTLVFVLPGIWLTGALAFAGYSFLDEGRTGRQALARSAQLVSGRWWSMVARIILPGFLILALSLIASSIVEVLVGIVAGYRPSAIAGQLGFSSWTVIGPASTQIAATALQVINALPLIVAMPLLTHLMITVYLELKRTR